MGFSLNFGLNALDFATGFSEFSEIAAVPSSEFASNLVVSLSGEHSPRLDYVTTGRSKGAQPESHSCSDSSCRICFNSE